MAKIGKLETEGPKLYLTVMLKRLVDTDLSDLINGDYRIIVYFERGRDKFWLLNGFKKTKNNQQDQINEGKSLLKELKEL